MPVDPHKLSLLASDYAKAMTSIRGRRVRRLIQREFAGADHVCIVQVGPTTSAIVGVSGRGAAFCATDGTGKHATVFKWLHASTTAVETRFDLWKDSLPALAAQVVPLVTLRRYPSVRVVAGDVSPDVDRLLDAARRVLLSAPRL